MNEERRHNEECFTRIERRIVIGGSGSECPPTSKEASFLKSRRTLRIWPIDGLDNTSIQTNVTDFIKNALMIDPKMIEEIPIESVKRVRNSPEAQSYSEVAVTFTLTADRDLVASRSRNLAGYTDQAGRPTAGIKMDIPQNFFFQSC